MPTHWRICALLCCALLTKALFGYSAAAAENEFYGLYGGVAVLFILLSALYLMRGRSKARGFVLGIITLLVSLPVWWIASHPFPFHGRLILPMATGVLAFVIFYKASSSGAGPEKGPENKAS